MRSRPTRVHDHHDRSSGYRRFNAAAAVWVTNAVGSMECAYLFTALALFGLPAAMDNGIGGLVQWVAQTFLQLVLLSVILVGGNVQAKAADQRAADTYADTEAILAAIKRLEATTALKDIP